jgi:hypothetical protein
MENNIIDNVIEDKLIQLREEKYKLRTFQIEMLVRIESDFGVEETLQDIRSIGGVTVVTALDSVFRDNSKSYLSHIKIKFHPRSDSTGAKTFLKDHLLPTIRSSEIPGCKVVRVIGNPEPIA